MGFSRSAPRKKPNTFVSLTGGVLPQQGYQPEDFDDEPASQDKAESNECNKSDEAGYKSDYAGCNKCCWMSTKLGSQSREV